MASRPSCTWTSVSLPSVSRRSPARAMASRPVVLPSTPTSTFVNIGSVLSRSVGEGWSAAERELPGRIGRVDRLGGRIDRLDGRSENTGFAAGERAAGTRRRLLDLAPQERAQLGDGAHQRRREDDGRVLVDRDLDECLQVAQLKRQRVSDHHVGGHGELTGRQRLALGGDDLGALLTLGLCLARCMLSGSWMSRSSTSVTLTPHSSVWTSRISRIFWLMASVSESSSSSVWRPTTARSVVCAIWLIAAATFSMATTERTGSSTR